MAEVAVGFARHAGEVVIGDGVADERPHHLDRDLGIGPPGEIRDRARIELGPGLRHIEAAVARKPGQRRLDKVERRSLAPGGDIAHGLAYSCRRPAADDLSY